MQAKAEHTFKDYATNLIKTAPNFVKQNLCKGVKGFEAKQTFDKNGRIEPVYIDSLDKLIQVAAKGDLICGKITNPGGVLYVGISAYNGIYQPKTANKDGSMPSVKVMISDGKGNIFADPTKVKNVELYLWAKNKPMDIDYTTYDPMALPEELKDAKEVNAV